MNESTAQAIGGGPATTSNAVQGAVHVGGAKPRRRGPKPSADLDPVVAVGAEFRALMMLDDGPLNRGFLLGLVRCPIPVERLATACAELSEATRPLAVAMCEALVAAEPKP